MFLSLLNKEKVHTDLNVVYFDVVLLPFNTFEVIASVVYYLNHTVTGQAF